MSPLGSSCAPALQLLPSACRCLQTCPRIRPCTCCLACFRQCQPGSLKPLLPSPQLHRPALHEAKWAMLSPVTPPACREGGSSLTGSGGQQPWMGPLSEHPGKDFGPWVRVPIFQLSMWDVKQSQPSLGHAWGGGMDAQVHGYCCTGACLQTFYSSILPASRMPAAFSSARG